MGKESNIMNIWASAPPPPEMNEDRNVTFLRMEFQYFNNFLNAYNGERDGAKVLIVIWQN
jgi:hypothetical protein